MLRISEFRVAVIVAVCVLLLAGCGSGGDDQQADAQAQSQDAVVTLPDFTSVVRQVEPAVVNISTLPADDDEAASADDGQDDKAPTEQPQAPDNMPFGMPQPSLGSGFIISADGYILTNRHVIRDAGRIVVKLPDRRQLIAHVVGADKYSDVAVLKVDATNLPTVTVGDVDQLEVGSWVLAIGSPFGFDTSVTAGIVSAKQRMLNSDQYVPFIQTDVAINPGNSGGPLFNLKGQVVGINSQIYTRSGGYQGVSFAIPIDIAMDVAQQLRAQGHVERGWLGVQIQNIDRDLAQSFGLEWPHGALVARVFPDSPASRVGLHTGDIILEFDDKPVPSANALPPLVGTITPGSSVKMRVLRNGRKEDFDVKIKPLPVDLAALSRDEATPAQTPEQQQTQGLTLQQLSADERAQMGLGDNGIRVVGVDDGAGAEAGLLTGDVILAVGKDWIRSPAAFVAAIKNHNNPLALLVWRHGDRLYLALQPQE